MTLPTQADRADDLISVVLYAAKSDADERDSIPSQTAEMRAEIEREGGRTMEGEHSDEAASAYSGSRGPGLTAAIEAAKQAAAEHGTAELWCFDPDRLARGDGRRARHLGGLYFELLADGVELRAVQGDADLRSAIHVVLRGERNYQDSAAKGGHVQRGIRATVARGQWRGGSLPDGYDVLHAVDERGTVSRTYRKSPERGPVIQLAFELLADGRSYQAVQLELSRRGYLTAPRRRGAQPEPFSVNRVSRILRCPVYAGLQWGHDGELVALGEDWPRFVEPEDWHRMIAERRERSHTDKRKPGRPPKGFLLLELARCATCGGPMRTETQRRPRKDGTRRRAYVCKAHAERHRDAPDWCAAMPFHAMEVDRMIVAGMDQLLGKADTWRRGVTEVARSEVERLDKVAESAQKERQESRHLESLAMADYARATDPERRELAADAAKLMRQQGEAAEARLTAALDARTVAAQPPEGDEQEQAMMRLWEVVSGRLADAKGDAKMVNATLRESFARFELSREKGGGYRIVPVAATLDAARILRDNAEWKGDPIGVRTTGGVGSARFDERTNRPAPQRTRARGPGRGRPSVCPRVRGSR
jgi:hypothetical protein